MNNQIKLSIVIPTYIENENIKKLIPSIEKVISKNKIESEIIVVDDDSPDGTADVAEELNRKYKNIRVIVRKNDKGLARALLEGFDKSRGEFIATLDADLCHDPELLTEMLSYVEKDNFDMVIGSRYVKGGVTKGKPKLKEGASRIGQLAARCILNLDVKDTSNNFRLFRKALYNKIKSDLHPVGNIMLTEIAYKAVKSGFKVKEIPIIYIEKRIDETKIALYKETFKFMIYLFKIKFNL